MKFVPSYGTVQNEVEYHYMISDGNSDLKTTPLALAEAM